MSNNSVIYGVLNFFSFTAPLLLIYKGFKLCYVLYKDEKILPKSVQRPASIISGKLIYLFISFYKFNFNLSLFDKFYGDKPLTLKRLSASLISTMCGVTFGILIFQIYFPPANWALSLLVKNYNAYIGFGALYLFILTFFINFMCVQKSRLFLERARNSNGLKKYSFILFDIITTPFVFVFIFFVGISVLSILYFVVGGTNFPINIEKAKGIVTIRSWPQLIFLAFYNEAWQCFHPLIQLFSAAAHGKMMATFIRIPAPITDTQYLKYIIRGPKLSMLGFVYPYIHSMLSSFTLVIWSIGMAIGSFVALIVRSMATIFGRALNRPFGMELFEKHRISLAAGACMVLLTIVVVFTRIMVEIMY